MEKPSVGRQVHYYRSDDAAPQAATVSALREDGTVDLHVLVLHPRAPVEYLAGVPGADVPTAGRWCWPARVEHAPEGGESKAPAGAEPVADPEHRGGKGHKKHG